MFGLLARLFRVLWRHESEGSETGATILAFPPSQQISSTFAAPVAFIRRSAEPAPTRHGNSPRLLAARLQSVQRLNPPSSRSRPKPAHLKAGKLPRPVAVAQIKPSRPAKPGVVLDRIVSRSRRGSADIVNLTEVRRARQIEAADLELTALFN
jgi:hypothetical protein